MPYFTYEKQFDNSFKPVVYFEKPIASSQSANRERIGMHEVNGKEFLGNDLVSPNFGLLTEKFPLDNAE